MFYNAVPPQQTTIGLMSSRRYVRMVLEGTTAGTLLEDVEIQVCLRARWIPTQRKRVETTALLTNIKNMRDNALSAAFRYQRASTHLLKTY